MKQPEYILKPGTLIHTHPVLGSTGGFFVVRRHLDARKANVPGTVGGVVPGHGGDVYYVAHGAGDDVAVYCFTEFELIVEEQEFNPSNPRTTA